MMRRNDEYDQGNMVWIKTDQHNGAFQAGIEKQVCAARISIREALAYEWSWLVKEIACPYPS